VIVDDDEAFLDVAEASLERDEVIAAGVAEAMISTPYPG
jgi:hypothetical protein